MKVVIDILEEEKKMVDAFMELPPQVENDLVSAIRHGTPLPKGHEVLVLPGHATNGDAIQRAFPNVFFDSYVNQVDGVDFISMDNEEVYFDLEWWNAPYKAGEEE